MNSSGNCDAGRQFYVHDNSASQIWRSMHFPRPIFFFIFCKFKSDFFFTWKRICKICYWMYLFSKYSNHFCNLHVYSFSVLFIVIGIAVFGGKMEQMGYSVGWSMGLAIAGVVLAFLAGIMEVLELRWSHFLPRHLFVPKILVTFFVACDVYSDRTSCIN